MHGNIQFHSEVNEGTSIQCAIPIKIEETQYYNNENKKLNITIFEDDPHLMNILNIMISKLGHNIVDISPETELIITDMDMGEISGFDILKKYNHLPIILATGRGDFNKDTALDYGFVNFISKPFKIEDIALAINGVDMPKNSFLSTLDQEDEEEIRELINNSIKENILLLEKSISENDFAMAKSVCHKLAPLFKQVNLDTNNFVVMDQHHDNEFEGLQNCVDNIKSLAEPTFC